MTKILIYTGNLCPFCEMAKDLLISNSLEFKEINVDLNPKKKSEMLKLSKGKTSVPQIFFGTKHIGGCDELYKIEEKVGILNLINTCN